MSNTTTDKSPSPDGANGQTPADAPPRADQAPGRPDGRYDGLSAVGRLDDLILRLEDPEKWKHLAYAKAIAILDQARAADAVGNEEGATRAFVALYRLAYRADLPMPKEYFFWLASLRLHMEANVGPDAIINGKEYLGPFWDRLNEIRSKYGWPKDDEDGDTWEPENHVDPLPEEYVAWNEELNRVAEGMDKAAFRAVCRKYGVEDIADLTENDPAEYERRSKIGHDFARLDAE